MNVIHVSTFPSGGATAAARRLNCGLRALGVQSSCYFAHHQGDRDPDGVWLEPSRKIRDRLTRKFHRRRLQRLERCQHTIGPQKLDLFSSPEVEFDNEPESQLPPCDVIHLHWISGFVDLNRWTKTLNSSVPFVWTLHDMNPFTGGCHYDNECGRYRDSCGNCPCLRSPHQNDLSRKFLMRKEIVLQRLIREKRLIVVTPSEWLAREAKSSRLMNQADVRTIPYGIETDTFRPLAQREALRAAFDLKKDHLALLFVCGNLNNYRKGMRYLIDALMKLKINQPVALLTVGEGEIPSEPQLRSRNIEIRRIGKLNEPRLMSLAYNLADIFVVPTLADNLPNTILESLSCGTPVVGFAVGGLPDMIRPGLTGELATLRDPKSLADAILRLADNPRSIHQLRQGCRKVVEEEYSIDRSAREYLEVYRSFSGS